MLLLLFLFFNKYISKRLVNHTKCDMCIKGLKTLNTSENIIGKEADLINMKTKGFLTYPNCNLYIIIKHIEECFAIHCNSNDVFEKNI